MDIKVSLKLITIGILVLQVLACEDKQDINSNKNTYIDDIADITALNGYFYSTNYDLSGNSGSQIDLLKYEINGDNIFLTDAFELDMNGQGYLAITSDGSDLYLQSRQTELLIKASGIGELVFLRYDDLASNWHPSGLAFNPDTDSLFALYRNSQAPIQYRMRTISKTIDQVASHDETFQLPFIDTLYHGVYALEYFDSHFYMLGVDTSYQDLLLVTDLSYNLTSIDTLSDSTVVGLGFLGHDLYLSYRDKRIEMWGSY